MAKKLSGEKVGRSHSFKSAKARAAGYAKDAGKLNDLLDRASRKADSAKQRLTGVRDSLQACLRLLRAYAGGRYRAIPWASLVSIIAAVIYFVMPLDFIPDFLLAIGLIDDAALLGWVLSSFKTDIDKFIEWELNNPSAGPDRSDTTDTD